MAEKPLEGKIVPPRAPDQPAAERQPVIYRPEYDQAGNRWARVAIVALLVIDGLLGVGFLAKHALGIGHPHFHSSQVGSVEVHP